MGLIPTPSEHAHGRLMRAEDHDGSDQTLLGGAGDDAAAAAAAEKAAADAANAEVKAKTEADDAAAAAAKSDEEKAAAEAKAKTEADEAAKTKALSENKLLGAPEGDYTIAGLPEGTTVDTEALAMLTPLAKEIGLSDEGMSKLVGLYATQILPHLDAQIGSAIETQAATQRKEWEAETRLAISGGKDAAGKAIPPAVDEKGESVYAGKTYKEVSQIAAKALDRFGGPGLREYLETSGLGNNEALVRFAFRAGQAIKEDSFDRGTGASGGKRSREEKFYGPQG